MHKNAECWIRKFDYSKSSFFSHSGLKRPPSPKNEWVTKQCMALFYSENSYHSRDSGLTRKILKIVQWIAFNDLSEDREVFRNLYPFFSSRIFMPCCSFLDFHQHAMYRRTKISYFLYKTLQAFFCKNGENFSKIFQEAEPQLF